jgi:hypothetical protein
MSHRQGSVDFMYFEESATRTSWDDYLTPNQLIRHEKVIFPLLLVPATVKGGMGVADFVGQLF